jgi:ribose-phosphate pyrophosphokinase
MGNKTHSLKVFTCRNTSYLAEKICDSLGIEMGKSSCPVFSDGEFEPYYDETIRGSHVFIVQSTPPPTDNLMELLLMIDAAKRASAYKIIAVIPYF